MGKPKCDFSGYATRNDLLCADGRVIRKDAFTGNNGAKVPLLWNHDHNNLKAVLGHAILENRDDGVYAYCVFNDSEAGKEAKQRLMHGDIGALSIWANQLKQVGNEVIHGNIRELSLVLAGANPGAFVDFVMSHSDDGEDELNASWWESLMLYHSAESGDDTPDDKGREEKKPEERTVQDVVDTMNEEQKKVFYGLLGELAEGDEEEKNDKKGGTDMKHNVFDNTEEKQEATLSHSDEMEIVELAKQSNVGSLRMAFKIFAEEHKDELAHGVFTDADTEKLFPEYELLKKGKPETLERDQSWIAGVISKTHKSPYSRIRTRQADARIAELKAKGYQKKGNYKQSMADIKMIGRTTDPQTIYIKDDMHRDDIVDITDFDVVAYQWELMHHILDETLAMAIMVGDGREEGDPDKIHEDHFRSIWHDDELYCLHQDVDFEAAKTKLQGTNTSANFSDNYIKAEAMIEAALYSREKFKGTGTPDVYCTPHLLNVMLLARDLISEGMPVIKAAAQSGFSDYTTFSRAYKKMFNKCPSAL